MYLRLFNQTKKGKALPSTAHIKTRTGGSKLINPHVNEISINFPPIFLYVPMKNISLGFSPQRKEEKNFFGQLRMDKQKIEFQVQVRVERLAPK